MTTAAASPTAGSVMGAMTVMTTQTKTLTDAVSVQLLSCFWSDFLYNLAKFLYFMLCFSKMNILRMILINLGTIFLKINNDAFVHLKFNTGALLASQCKSGVEALFHLLPPLIMM